MGDKMSQTCQGTWSRGQTTITVTVSSAADGRCLPFQVISKAQPQNLCLT